MTTFLATVIVFALAFLGMAAGILLGRRWPGCSCKEARKVMNRTETCGCGQGETCGEATQHHRVVLVNLPEAPGDDA